MTHTTRDGETILISEMEDSHLKNTVNFHINRMAMAKSVLAKKEEDRDDFFETLYNKPRLNKGEAKNIVKHFMKNISPYILEKLVRDIPVEDDIAQIQSLIERKAKFSTIEYNLLPEIDDEGIESPYEDNIVNRDENLNDRPW